VPVAPCFDERQRSQVNDGFVRRSCSHVLFSRWEQQMMRALSQRARPPVLRGICPELDGLDRILAGMQANKSDPAGAVAALRAVQGAWPVIVDILQENPSGLANKCVYLVGATEAALACGWRLAAEGAHVVVFDHQLTRSQLWEIEMSRCSAAQIVTHCEFDMADPQQAAESAAVAMARIGPPDLVVNVPAVPNGCIRTGAEPGLHCARCFHKAIVPLMAPLRAGPIALTMLGDCTPVRHSSLPIGLDMAAFAWLLRAKLRSRRVEPARPRPTEHRPTHRMLRPYQGLDPAGAPDVLAYRAMLATREGLAHGRSRLIGGLTSWQQRLLQACNPGPAEGKAPATGAVQAPAGAQASLP
jgi:hypothetical protein